MRIDAICVCVDYSEYLAKALPLWLQGCETFLVVTSPKDEATQELARVHDTHWLVTDAFYEDGAYFNKGRALQQARDLSIGTGDWQLFVDADVVPPDSWKTLVEEQIPKPGCLHGARRKNEAGKLIDDRELAGFFQLFHKADPRADAPIDIDWLHAGNYDSTFMMRWPGDLQVILPLVLQHYGEVGTNWCGKGNVTAMTEIRRQRAAGRHWRKERVERR